MARTYSNENIPLQVVEELRRLGHDALTSHEAGKADRGVPDEEVLAFAATERRILLTQNRRHFPRLHQRRAVAHSGIVVCAYDPDFTGQAKRVHDAISTVGEPANHLVRVNRPG
jgi:hypothetical protein